MPKYTGELEWKVVDLQPKADGELPAVHVVGFKGGQPVEPGPAWRYGPASEKAARDQAETLAAARNERESLVRDRGGAQAIEAEAVALDASGAPRPFALHEEAAAAQAAAPTIPTTQMPAAKTGAHGVLSTAAPKGA